MKDRKYLVTLEIPYIIHSTSEREAINKCYDEYTKDTMASVLREGIKANIKEIREALNER